MGEDQTEVESLRAENARLRAELEKLRALVERLQRCQKRQTAPFSKGPPKPDPKKPGRKSGEDYGPIAYRKVPAEVDETYLAALPEECPFCGSGVELVSTAEQYQAEIPRKPIHRKFTVQIGCCSCCGKRVQGRHALQTSNALGATQSQLGPDAQALGKRPTNRMLAMGARRQLGWMGFQFCGSSASIWLAGCVEILSRTSFRYSHSLTPWRSHVRISVYKIAARFPPLSLPMNK